MIAISEFGVAVRRWSPPTVAARQKALLWQEQSPDWRVGLEWTAIWRLSARAGGRRAQADGRGWRSGSAPQVHYGTRRSCQGDSVRPWSADRRYPVRCRPADQDSGGP